MSTTLIVVYCPTCDYFLKIAVQVVAGTHGCAQCDGLMEVYVPQELMRAESVPARAASVAEDKQP